MTCTFTSRWITSRQHRYRCWRHTYLWHVSWVVAYRQSVEQGAVLYTPQYISQTTLKTNVPPASTVTAAPATWQQQQQQRGDPKLSVEQQAMAPIAKYFKLKAAKKQELARAESQRSEEQLFADMLAGEMKTIKSAAVKRKLKWQLLDTVCAAQQNDVWYRIAHLEVHHWTSPKRQPTAGQHYVSPRYWCCVMTIHITVLTL